MLVLGIQPRDSGGYKDTCANVIETGELVINLVAQSDAETMNHTSAETDPEFDEIAAFDIPTLPSTCVAPPRIATSPVSFECRKYQIIQPSSDQTIVLAGVHRRPKGEGAQKICEHSQRCQAGATRETLELRTRAVMFEHAASQSKATRAVCEGPEVRPPRGHRREETWWFETRGARRRIC
jgi:hypothetical protein